MKKTILFIIVSLMFIHQTCCAETGFMHMKMGMGMGPKVMATSSSTPTYISNGDIDDEDMADITDWTDVDSGAGDSSQATFDGKSCMKMDVPGAGNAARYQDIGTFGTRTVISLNIYFEDLGAQTAGRHFQLNIYEGSIKCLIKFGTDGLFIYDGSSYVEVETDLVVADVWEEWTFDIDWTAMTVDVYLDEVLQKADVDCSFIAADVAGKVVFTQYQNTINTLSYIDWFKAGSDFE